MAARDETASCLTRSSNSSETCILAAQSDFGASTSREDTVSKDWESAPQSVRSRWTLSVRTGLATGWFWAHGYDVQSREATKPAFSSWLCCHCIHQKAHKPKSYVSSNTRNIEGHLSKAHNIFNPDPAKARRLCMDKSPNQPDLHQVTAKKRKTDDFRDELTSRFDRDQFQRLLVRWITDANLSFRVSEHEGLRKVFDYLNPMVAEASANLTHKTIRTKIIQEFHSYQAHIIETLLQSPSKIHIAFDGWTFRNRHSFFAINAFFLDEDQFRPRKILLGLPNLSVAHTGNNISASLADVLGEFQLVHGDQVGFFVMDNAPNNDCALDELGQRLSWRDPPAKRVRCFGHVLHLVARALLFVNDEQTLENLDADDFNEWTKAGPVGKLHNLVVWIHRSNSATITLRRLQNDDVEKDFPGTLDVILDNSTRWLSQYYMIERAIKLRRYLEDLVDVTLQSSKKLNRSRTKPLHSRRNIPRCLEDENLLSDSDWNALCWLKDILANFNSCLLRLEGDGQVRVRKGGHEAQYGVIWQVAVAYEFLLSTLEKAKAEARNRPEPSYYASCINSAWSKLNKYYTKLDETPVYYAATVLHPGIQWTFLNKAYGDRDSWLSKARQLVRSLWEDEYRDLPVRWKLTDSSLPVALRARESNAFDSFQNELLSSSNTEPEPIEDEFDRWLATKQDIYTTHDNPLQYWSTKRFEYPRIAKMAIDVLSVPAMAAECERTFSSAGTMVSPKRTRLDASTISVAQTVRSWLKAGLLDNYDGLLKEFCHDKIHKML